MVLRFLSTRAGVAFTGWPDAVIRRVSGQLFAQTVGEDSCEERFPRVLAVGVGEEQTGQGPGLRVSRQVGGLLVCWRGGWVSYSGGATVRAGVIQATGEPLPEAALLSLAQIGMFGALALQGYSVLHAGAFEVGGRGVLVVGESGAGKSTLAALALRLGGRIVSDDSVLVWAGASPGAVVGAMRADAVLREAGVRLIPHDLRCRLITASFDGVQRPVLPRAAVPHVFADSCTPKLLLLVRVDRRRRASQLARVSAAEGLAALVASTSPVFLSPELPQLRAKLLPPLVAIASEAAAYRVALGRAMLDGGDDDLTRLLAQGRPS